MAIAAAIFDMDGLLVDSEPLWTRAEIETFRRVGIELDAVACGQTVGMGIDEVVALRFGEKPWSGPSQADVAERIRQRVVDLVRSEGRPMPGALEALAFARSHGVRVGLASSSDPAIIRAVLASLDLEAAFDHVQSSERLQHSKPHPAIYLAAAERLSAPPALCVAFEDSIPGLIAAKAARMKAVAVPEPRLAKDPRFSLADVVLTSLAELDEAVWRRLG